MVLPVTKVSALLLPPLKSNRPEPSRVSAPATAVPVCLSVALIVEERLLVVSPSVSAAPLLRLIALLLPTVFSVVSILFAVTFNVAAAGWLLTLDMSTPETSVAKTLVAERVTAPNRSR